LLTVLLLAPAIAAPQPLKVRPQPGVNSTTIELPLEKYVAAVLAGEASVLESDEALKALAVAARTFGVYARGRHASRVTTFAAPRIASGWTSRASHRASRRRPRPLAANCCGSRANRPSPSTRWTAAARSRT